jgi:MFS family permease
MDPARRGQDGALSPRFRSLTIASVLLVTLGAYENRATMTVLPGVVEDLGGLRWFGVTAGMSAVTYLAAAALAGVWTDHGGPRRVLVASLTTFVAAQVVTAAAPDLLWFVAGRALSGVGEGGLDIALIVLVADLAPDRVRAKILATFSTAWILPSLVGPGVAGGLAEWAGWRVAFLAPLLLAVPAAFALAPPIRRAPGRPPRRWTRSEHARIVTAALVAAAIATLTWSAAAAADGDVRAIVVAASSVLAIALLLHRVLPRGTLALAPGTPALVGQSLVVSLAFAAAGGFLPLLFASVLHLPAWLVGSSLSVTGIFWALGSNAVSSDRAQARLSRARATRLGALLIAGGSVGPLLVALDVLPYADGLVLWAVAATGMGMANNSLAVQLIAVTEDDERGRVGSSRTIAAAVGASVATAFGGALVAAGSGDLDGRPIAAVIGLGVLAALLSAATADRIDPR